MNDPKTIDVTPTWSGILPALLAIVANGETFEARKEAQEQLAQMAKLADLYNERLEDADEMRDALLVVNTSPAIRDWLVDNDLQCLKQVNAALGCSDSHLKKLEAEKLERMSEQLEAKTK